MEKKKVVIIGAGPAGLTMAQELLKENGKEKFDVTILEESQEIGGISKTVKYNGNRMDIGGHRFFSKDERVMNFWEDLMPIQGVNSFDDEKLGREKPLKEGGPNPEVDDDVMLIRQRVSRIYYLKKFFDYPISMKMQTFKNMGLWRTIKAGFSYLKAAIFKKIHLRISTLIDLEKFFTVCFLKNIQKNYGEDIQAKYLLTGELNVLKVFQLKL